MLWPGFLGNTLVYGGLVAALVLGARSSRRSLRRRSGRCPACGYDLSGNPGAVCPECGRQEKSLPPAAATSAGEGGDAGL
jgi:hypothetical protein